MLEKYGLQSSVASGSYNIAREPLYFVRSGNIVLSAGELTLAGHYGRAWSNTAAGYGPSSWDAAYYFIFDTWASYPSHGPNNRWDGFPVRCLVY